ncbi:MAG: hypothetical protein PHD88_10430 [Firmicutes bacterium]|nr:hypothetical protein [Bacillota bacterium]MDD4263190.1 hypothetical protein [Bacillota bacterium]MDD4694776.1 hypothetical protein [Bacillota bacterium]
MLKRTILVGILLLMMASLSLSVFSDSSGLKYISNNSSFSFKYPFLWEVHEGDSSVMLKNTNLDQELWLMIVPYNSSKSAKEHAQAIISAFSIENPTFSLSSWRHDLGEDGILFELDYSEGCTFYKGIGLVLLDRLHLRALWLHFLTPKSTYVLEDAVVFTQAFLDSLTVNEASENLTVKTSIMAALDYKTVYITRNAKAFLDILEFALDLSLSKEQEKEITTALINSWRSLSDAELALYNKYPKYAETIATLNDSEQIEKLKMALRGAVEDKLFDSIAVVKEETSLFNSQDTL